MFFLFSNFVPLKKEKIAWSRKNKTLFLKKKKQIKSYIFLKWKKQI